ncbi:MerR family transcriptional regulator [Enterococcus pallens]|uniref:HTH merR-type domain-containing protein n=1 Tax=Enterococcus pallens ATCC BAA-351 TaxID=1158607 RepID=R2SMP8_9ENTE|nr:MerR family transcriptional regulator [Enterococcus pallens]EOH94166.1 hypothetical protein UAU_01901 [Enterococcus pallens ATCC BAA-351]EOU24045.1 hypothetical protein I588_00032 [Enterococcus pallens ATCC BAA-351]OJG76357.1 hypothetical protein RV10_GL003829 [Enterococcus pallens]
MDILTVSEKTGLTPKTLRYYERMGFIPKIKRDRYGARVYTELDLEWIDFFRYMMKAGLPSESLIDYATLCTQGNETIPARKELLKEELSNLQCKCNEIQETMKNLASRINDYELREKQIP